MHEHALAVYRTARYFALGEGPRPIDEVWIVCHGYGQHPARFLRPFRALEAPHRLIVAPEGLSRFYLEAVAAPHRHVGASWMTRENREAEIDDYVRFIDSVYADVLHRAGLVRARLVVLGFSQGGATATRWLARSPALGDPPADRLILWGSGLPHDLALETHGGWLGRARLTLVAGTDDAWATPERVAEQERLLRAHGIPYETIGFEGGHRLDEGVLRRLAES